MSGEQIMDALGYLDDDLLEATGRLRTRRRRSYWLLPVVTAACLYLVIFAAINQSKSAPEANGFGNVSDGFYGELMPEAPMESAGSAAATATAVIRVTEITDTGFMGDVTDADSGGDLKAEPIAIVCNSDIVASLQVGDLVRVSYRKEQDNVCIHLTIIEE